MHKAFRFVVLMVAALALLGCGVKIADKMVVKIGYTGTLADGSTFDSSEGSDPLEFMVGGGQMIPQFEQNLVGLKKGDKKTFVITAADAYGVRDEAALQEVPLEAFGDMELTAGMQLATSNPVTGEQMIVTVAELKKDSRGDRLQPPAGRQGPDLRDRGRRRAQAHEGRAFGAGVRRGSRGRIARHAVHRRGRPPSGGRRV